MTVRRLTAALVGTLVLVAGACSGEDDAASTTTTVQGPTTETSAAPAATLQILVTNDDGIEAPGIDAVVTALRAMPDVEVEVIAPAEQQSGTGGSTTEGELTATDATTDSGVAAMAVDGFPADAVIWALDQGGVRSRPHLLVSGVNEGQNLGPVIDISGTVGAARAAVVRGVPALAASQGYGDPPDFEVGARKVVEWVEANRDDLLVGAAPVQVVSLNIPTCGRGEVREVVDVSPAAVPRDRDVAAADIDCTARPTEYSDDVDAFNLGYVTRSVLPNTPAS